MSINLDAVAVKQFENDVKHAFQEGGKVRNSVRVKDAKGANIVQFNLMGKGQATQRNNYHTPIPVMNVTHTPKNATVTNWTASELTDIFLNNQVGFDERNELVKTVKMALERRVDQIIIDALENESLTKTVADTISGAADNLTVDAIRDSARQLDIDGVDESDRWFLGHASGKHHLLSDTETTSSDYMNVKALVAGDIDTFYGFNFIWIGNRDEGGLAVPSANHRHSFAYQKLAVGLAMNMDIKVTIDWEPSFGAHRVTGYLSAGAVIIDPTGGVEIETDES